jgi:beta-glucanase (GH16 family)
MLTSASAALAQTVSDHHPEGYTLVFSDEFDGEQLDRNRWCTRYIYGGGATPQVRDPVCQVRGGGSMDWLNDEKQRYVDFNVDKLPLHEVKDGVLTLIATMTGKTAGAPFQSAMIRSKREFRPDATTSLYITARVKLPNVRGTWPAFWINSGPNEEGKLAWPPEIDIFEAALNEKEDRENMLHVGTVISSAPRKLLDSHPAFNRQWRNYVARESLRERWIETAIEWSENQVCYVIEGVRAMCEEYEWRHRSGRLAPPGHLLLNLAIGGQWAGRHGIATEKFPARFSVDYVRVYEKRIAP